MEIEMTENKVESGKFKTEKKFLGFVSGTGGNIRILTDVAKISGKKLSGTLEDSEFQIQVYPDGSVDFTQLSGESIGEEMMGRLLDEMVNSNVTPYFGKSILSEYNFKNSEGILCYLEVEYEKPIEKLAKLFEVEEKKPSQKALDILNSLFGDLEEDEIPKDEVQIDSEPKSNIGVTNQILEESFNKMNSEKISELETRLERVNSEINKTRFEIKTGEDKLKNLSQDFKVLSSRINSMKPHDGPNGWVFNVSEKVQSDVEMSEETSEIIKKISKILNLVPEKVEKAIADGYFTINLTPQEDEVKDVPIEILKKISEIDPLGNITRMGDFEFRYSGEFNWHELVDVLIRKGFVKS